MQARTPSVLIWNEAEVRPSHVLLNHTEPDPFMDLRSFSASNDFARTWPRVARQIIISMFSSDRHALLATLREVQHIVNSGDHRPVVSPLRMQTDALIKLLAMYRQKLGMLMDRNGQLKTMWLERVLGCFDECRPVFDAQQRRVDELRERAAFHVQQLARSKFGGAHWMQTTKPLVAEVLETHVQYARSDCDARLRQVRETYASDMHETARDENMQMLDAEIQEYMATLTGYDRSSIREIQAVFQQECDKYAHELYVQLSADLERVLRVGFMFAFPDSERHRR